MKTTTQHPRDPTWAFLWRFAPRRLEGEAVRDAMLAVSGQLNPQVGGPSFRPFTVTVFNSSFYALTDPPDRADKVHPATAFGRTAYTVPYLRF